MVSFVHKDQFEERRVEFVHPIPRIDALHGSDCDICGTRGMDITHFNLDGFGRIGIGTVARSLLHKLPTVSQDECLRSMLVRNWNSVNELSKYDLMAMLVFIENVE